MMYLVKHLAIKIKQCTFLQIYFKALGYWDKPSKEASADF